MKKNFLIAILMATGTLHAQTPALYECIYEYNVNGTSDKGALSEIYNCMLQIGENGSRFVDYAAYQLDSVSAIPGINTEILKEYEKKDMQASPYFDREIRYSPLSSMLTMQGQIGLNYGKYEEKVPVTEWTLTDETDTICGYECRKATGNYGDRDWTIWFAEDIPAPYGPWKFAGLPGLVMKAEDSEGIHRFTAIAYRQATVNIPVDRRPNVLKMDHNKFEQMKNVFDSDPFHSVNPSDIRTIDVLTDNQTVKVNGIQFRVREKGFIPLEKWTEADKAKATRQHPGESIKVIGSGTSMKK